jgi:hypothetical protein
LKEYFISYSPQVQVSAALGFISPTSAGEAHFTANGFGQSPMAANFRTPTLSNSASPDFGASPALSGSSVIMHA